MATAAAVAFVVYSCKGKLSEAEKLNLSEDIKAHIEKDIQAVEEELDETKHWIDMIMRCQMLPISRMEPLSQECSELLSIIVKSIVTTKTRMTTDNH